ncbi:hypothetical protein J3F80_002930 [Coemansia sp. RSA 2526]|nr:hypothetical protein IW144_003339 [Coemansia sp. RSA 522]KAJ2407261.1 hypothetical protein J3F80_002930 [Coemansia sp. RSA 2526]
MVGSLETKSKAEAAQHIAQWATNELGFRKKTTLVTARGEENIVGDDIEPLLQGELAAVLDLASSHLVSMQNATDSRRKLAIYCAQPHVDKDAQSLDHILLRRSLSDLRTKERNIMADIKGVELENQAAIQAIKDAAAKRRAIEARIRELRLQILKKQLMAENVRRLTSRMRVFAQEMSTGADSAQTPGILPEVAEAILGPIDRHGGNIVKCPSELLARLNETLQLSQSDKRRESLVNQQTNGDSGYEQSQVLIAGVLACLKDLHDRDLKDRSSAQEAHIQLNLSKTALINKLEEVAGQLNLSAAANGNMIDDYKPLILQVALRNAATLLNGRVELLVPKLESASEYKSTEEDHISKAADVAKAIKHIQQLTYTTRQMAAVVNNIADSEVAASFSHLLPALRYTDLRDLWNSISLTSLQRIDLEQSNGGKETRSTDKLVARSCYSDANRDTRLCDVTCEAIGNLDQAFEVVIQHLGDQVVHGLRVAHMMRAVDGELATSHAMVEQVVNRQKTTPTEFIEAAVDGLRVHAQNQRAAAGAAMTKWAATSNVPKSLQVAKDSVDTEETIVRLSDTSGRLFTDLFAPWHQRDGTSYAEYLKQLKLVRASDKQTNAE